MVVDDLRRIVVLTNTSSPAWDQIHQQDKFEKYLNDVKMIYHSIFPFVLCPPELFYNIIHVNRLRSKAMKFKNMEDTMSQVQEAYDILADIQAFSPSGWAETRYFDD